MNIVERAMVAKQRGGGVPGTASAPCRVAGGDSPAQRLGRKPARRGRVLAGVFLMAVLAGACSPAEDTRSVFTLGTVCSVSLFGNGNGELYAQIFDRLSAIEAVMSANELTGGGTSELGRVNQSAGKQAVSVSAELMAVLRRALYFAELTGGAFNPAIGPLVKLWGIGTENARLPDEGMIRDALALTDYRDVEVDAGRQTVYLQHEGMSLDLGGIAKGYAADEVVKLLREAGIRRAVIDLGGNVYAHGSKSNGQKWRIGVQNPLLSRGEYLAVEEAADKALVTSGVYERFFEENGIRYHHILDSKTGYPAATGLLSVTIITVSSTDADALSTSVFALGYEKSAALLSFFPGTEAVFVFEDASIKRLP